MSRKEMMIAAVLVNAGLLILLFASALKPKGTEETALVKEASVVEKASEVVAKNQDVVVVGSEVDRAVQTLAAAQAQPVIEAPAEHAISFVDEIKSIATPVPVVQTLMAPLAEHKTSPFIEVKVKKGDMLEKIARHNNSTVSDIMKANNLTNSNLHIGQVLKIPQKEKVAATVAVADDAKWYVVKKGDSPWTIAVKNHMKVEDLLKLNEMNETQAKRLKPGDKIRIQ
ncbi:MAG: hypothetical protein RLZZ453_625 [Chlamydiota bacterium]|jgi:LysM repeat protein